MAKMTTRRDVQAIMGLPGRMTSSTQQKVIVAPPKSGGRVFPKSGSYTPPKGK